MQNKIVLDDIEVETLNFNRPVSTLTFIINDGFLLKKETLLSLPYRFLLISSKRRLDIYTPYYHDAIDSRFAPFGGQGKEYAELLIHDIYDQYLKGTDFSNIYYGGISLGGLHAVYASTMNEIPFTRFFSICGSFWYPNFVDYVKDNKPKDKTFYLLNGKKEGVNHPSTPLQFALSSATEIAKTLKENNKVEFITDEYSHHDHLTDRFLSLIKSMML